ncbi:hypothetical protein HZA75_02235 [Candidatus Roizmanbacteria bacterium]|nr:hypothetical protein [Candidatus Roizmanbacteria bacterium]
MDQNLSAEEKKKIYDELFDVFFIQLKTKKLAVEEGRKIAGYILDNFNPVDKKNDFLNFLEKLCEKWPLFNNYFLNKKGKSAQEQDKKKIEEITAKINKFIN